jgi:hypothetical protein
MTHVKTGPLYVRAWLPSWAEYTSLWFVGHYDDTQLSDEVLDTHLAATLAEGLADPADFDDYLMAHGYISLHTGADGLVYTAELPEPTEGSIDPTNDPDFDGYPGTGLLSP